jgi:hypothetical protein
MEKIRAKKQATSLVCRLDSTNIQDRRRLELPQVVGEDEEVEEKDAKGGAP